MSIFEAAHVQSRRVVFTVKSMLAVLGANVGFRSAAVLKSIGLGIVYRELNIGVLKSIGLEIVYRELNIGVVVSAL